MIQFKIIDKSKQFRDLKMKWEALLDRTANRSITQTWEWLYTWWDVYGKKRRLFIIAGYEDDELIGIAPFSIPRMYTWRGKILPFRTLFFICCGKTSERNVSSDYLDLIIFPGKEEKFVTGLLEYLTGFDFWDEIILESVSAESSVPGLLQQKAPLYGLSYEVINDAPSILIKLPSDWNMFLDSLSRSLRYKIRRGRKELQKLGGRYRIVQHEHELNSAFEAFEKLHQQRWQERGEPGAFSSDSWKAFQTSFARVALKKGWLKFCLLQVRDKVIAVNYNFAFNGVVHFFQSGMVPNENKHIRPGLLLHSFCIEDAIQQGMREYDFLRFGGFNPEYKKMWGNWERQLLDIRIARPSLRQKVYYWLSKIS